MRLTSRHLPGLCSQVPAHLTPNPGQPGLPSGTVQAAVASRMLSQEAVSLPSIWSMEPSLRCQVTWWQAWDGTGTSVCPLLCGTVGTGALPGPHHHREPPRGSGSPRSDGASCPSPPPSTPVVSWARGASLLQNQIPRNSYLADMPSTCQFEF